jgi:DNA-binding GntR family transcriptional regulator
LEFSYLSKRFQTAVTDHEAILDCLIEGDAEGAAEAMVLHIDRVIRNVIKYFAKKYEFSVRVG